MPLRLGPAIVCVILAIYRAVWLSMQLSGLSVREVAFLLLADSAAAGIFLLLAWSETMLRGAGRRIAAAAAVGVLVIVYLFYVADLATVRTLNARLQLADLRRFGSEVWLAPGFVSGATIGALAVAVAGLVLKIPISARWVRLVPGTGLVLLCLPAAVPSAQIPSYLQKYTGSVLLLARELWGSRPQPITRYTAGDFAAYGDEYDRLFDVPFAQTGTDVILVIVESLSAADSQRTSGLRNLLPDLDALSRNGMLFRNFLANFEASEGGIVALLSGTPPLHFPTASTNTFGEYALQRGAVASFARAGYQTEFLTSVPLQFISMDHYARSPRVGFRYAAGQHETARFRDAPRYAFESPGDHVLYEEVLGRLDSDAGGSRRPRFTAVITASSHPPYVDPLGRRDAEENVWDYVQRELRWLHDELSRRRYFERGVLLITGDHRRMTPISQSERDRYGESAKARIPLIVIGKGVPRGVVDDRLLQQADLLRMLDRAVQPQSPLSSHALWVERYVFVLGVASNASTLQVFEPGSHMREGFRLNLRGAAVEWLTPPPRRAEIERAIHRQRALQQAARASAVSPVRLTIGATLTAGDRPGVLVGHSADANIARDPDDPQGGLRRFTAPALGLEDLLRLAEAPDRPFTLTIRTFLRVPAEGEYWFSVFADDESCVAIDGETVLECTAGINEGPALLTAGVHRLDLRYVNRSGSRALDVKWLPPGGRAFEAIPPDLLIVPGHIPNP